MTSDPDPATCLSRSRQSRTVDGEVENGASYPGLGALTKSTKTRETIKVALYQTGGGTTLPAIYNMGYSPASYYQPLNIDRHSTAINVQRRASELTMQMCKRLNAYTDQCCCQTFREATSYKSVD